MDAADKYLALQVLMRPTDANGNAIGMLQPNGQYAYHLAVFGGVILSYIDQAGAVGARREVVRAGGAAPMIVTVAMNRVEFKQPLLVGDVVRFWTRRVRIGRTSITMQVSVEAERGSEVLHVTEAEVVYVGVDPDGPERKPRPLLG